MTLLDRPGTSGDSDDNRAGKRAARPSGSVGGHSKLRLDIEGLRAVATFLVLPYHAGLMLFPGGFVGVDVFFVISGFVITGQLLREADRDGHVSLGRFYARRAKRLLPAAGVVLVATAAMVYFLVPKIRWGNSGGDIAASAVYFINYHLANRSVDYLAEDVPPSPVQHYWSLSVEEQFYFVWPLLVLLVIWITARMQRKADVAAGLGTDDLGRTSAQPRLFRPVLFTVILVLALISLAWSTWSAINTPERAYFDTAARMWEFAAGTIVAILISRFDRFPQWFGAALAWTGLAMILFSARVYDKDIVWPGALALVPILGACFFIAGGASAGSKGPVALIGNKFMVLIGTLTYSLYLWHWPLLIVARERNDGSIPVWQGMIIVVLCIIPAWLTYKLVENPIRHSKFVGDHVRAAIGVGIISTLVAVVAGLGLANAFANEAGGGTRPVEVGGINEVPDAVDTSEPWSYDPVPLEGDVPEQITSFELGDIAPNPLTAEKDVPSLYQEGCQTQVDSSDIEVCTYGPDDAETTIAVVGDSKAAQWVPALEALADTKSWKVQTYTKSACPFVDASVTQDGGEYETCREWGQKVLDRLTGDDKPDVVLTAQGRKTAMASDEPTDTSEEAMEEGLRSYWSQLEDAGVTVISLADNPQTGEKAVYECVADNLGDVTECEFDRAEAIEASGVPVQRKAAQEAEIPFIDLTDYICPPGESCPPIIGNTLVYRQGSHITKTYVEVLAKVLGAAMDNAIAWSAENRDGAQSGTEGEGGN